jgi:hypothetical protein
LKTNTHFWSYLAKFLLDGEMFQRKLAEKIKTHILCPKTFFLKIVPFCLYWKNFVQQGRPQMTIWRMRIACWIPKATDTYTLKICNTYCFSIARVVERMGLNVTLYIHWLSCSLISDSLPVTLLLHRFLTTSTRAEIWGIHAIFMAVKVILGKVICHINWFSVKSCYSSPICSHHYTHYT